MVFVQRVLVLSVRLMKRRARCREDKKKRRFIDNGSLITHLGAGVVVAVCCLRKHPYHLPYHHHHHHTQYYYSNVAAKATPGLFGHSQGHLQNELKNPLNHQTPRQLSCSALLHRWPVGQASRSWAWVAVAVEVGTHRV